MFADLKLKRGCTTASVGKPGFIACAVCGVTRYYSCVYRRYGHFTCQVCYRFFRTFFSKPNQYSCAKLGDCPLNVRVRCRACWIQACINTYTVDGDRKQILDVYKPIKAPHHNGSNTESSNSALHALSIGSEQQLTIADSIGNDKYSSNESMSLLQQLKAHDSSSVASLRYINSMNAANVNSLFHLGGVNLSSSANVRSNAGGRSSDILNDEEEEVDDDPTVEVDDDEEPLDDESAGSRASLVMDESIDEDRPEIGLGDSDLGHRQQASLDSSLMNGTGGRKRALNDESNESEMDSSPTGLFGNQGTITDANINTITSAIKTTTTGSNDTSEKSRLHLLAGRQQLQRLLCQDLDKPITAQDL